MYNKLITGHRSPATPHPSPATRYPSPATRHPSPVTRYFLLVTILLFTGCGYKPLSHYSKSVLGQKIHIVSQIEIKDPKNSIVIKDALNEAIIKRFGGSISSKEDADSVITAKIKDIDFKPLVYDKQGYVSVYRADIYMEFEYEEGRGGRRYDTKGSYDFPIGQESVISESERYNAIKEASLEAIDRFISYIALKGQK